jgi:CheY-like chemotaxis protein
MSDTSAERLHGRRVLIVEDEYLLAMDLQDQLEELGARVLGPAPSVATALRLLDSEAEVEAATLDVTLGGEKCFAVADALRARGVPFVFVTGYDGWTLPEEYRDFPRCSKPVQIEQLARALFG